MKKKGYLYILYAVGIINWVFVIIGFLITVLIKDPAMRRAVFEQFSVYLKFSFLLPAI